MSNLRQAAQRALKAMEDGEDRADMIEFSDALIALRAALAEHDRLAGIEAIEKTAGIHVSQQAEPDSDYERGFVDGMNLQTKGSVDKAVNRVAQTTHWEGCEAVHPECRKPEQEPVALVEQLWAIIDDIDTYTDMAKADDKLYRSLVERRQADRWKTGITTDGYTLNIPSCSAPTPRKPLTDEALHQVIRAGNYDSMEQFARAIERAHGIGEQHDQR